MKVRITVPALAVLARDQTRMLKLSELGFTVRNELSSDGAAYMVCQDDLEKNITLEQLTALTRELKLVATVFPDGSITLEGA